MSSHHFVKEGQEPALLILEAVSFEVTSPLLEWAPQVIVHENALDSVLQWGIKIDTVIASGTNRIDLRDKLIMQAPVKILESDADHTLETVMYYLITTRQAGVTITHTDASACFSALAPFVGKLNITLLTRSQKWSAVVSVSFRKWMPAGHILHLYSQSTVEASGFAKSGDHYIVLHDGMINLSSDQPFWVGETTQT
jgi:hypothetical protein